MANTMTQFVVAQFIEDSFIGDTVSVHNTLGEAIGERDKIMENEKAQELPINRNLKVFEVTSKERA